MGTRTTVCYIECAYTEKHFPLWQILNKYTVIIAFHVIIPKLITSNYVSLQGKQTHIVSAQLFIFVFNTDSHMQELLILNV